MIITDNDITFSFFPGHEKYAENFFAEYQFINFDFALSSEKENLKPITKRSCKYCGKKYPETTFNNKAHTIPQFLGNTFSLSDFECDRCNKLFGKYEKQLSNFLGSAMTLNRTRGKKKIPDYYSPDNSTNAKKVQFFDAKLAIEISNQKEENNFFYDKENNEFSIEFKTQPYIPINVYKAFLKMAIGLIPEQEIPYLDLALKLLQNKNFSEKIKTKMLSVYTHALRISYNYTGIFLFKRINPLSLVPPYSMILFYGTCMYQIYVPLSNEYFKQIIQNKKPIKCPLLPPILPDNETSNFDFKLFTDRLDSTTPISKNQLFTIRPDRRDLKLVSFNPTTLSIQNAEFDPNSVIKFLLIDDSNFKIPINKAEE